jgi:asparagine synthase (glutamine-hydrolysing)
MCGIAGIIAYHYAAPEVDAGELGRIAQALAARGPDGSGEWLAADRRVGFAHRRLAIIDLSERAAQPMRSADGQLTVTFNGEIYNYRALRDELIAAGDVPRTESDTEVLLLLYARHGERMLERLRGMYAFALHDARRGQLLLARDPYGIKPLYYADDGWTLRFASQVRALRAGGRVAATRDPAGMVGFLMLGSVPEPFTSHLEVRAVPAGTALWVDASGPGPARRHFSVASCYAAAPHADGGELREVLRDAVLDSVRHHLVADVEVGLFLSSGIDSSALLALVAELGGQPPRTLTLGFEEFRGAAEDETPLAAEAARLYGAPHAVRRVTRQEFDADLPRILAAMDQPSIDGLNSWFVSKAARELGLKVALSGLGGDELFGGYPAFVDVPRWNRRLRLPASVPGAGKLFRIASGAILPRLSGVSPKLAGLLELGGTVEGAYFLRRGLFMPWELEGFLDPELVAEGLRRFDPLEYLRERLLPRPTTDFGRVASLESCVYMRNQLLRDTDWASMAHGLEVRTPLVDATLLRALAPHLASLGPSGAKGLLAGATRPPLPHAIAARAKTGFTTPIRSWLESSALLQGWQRHPALARSDCHWSRRLAVALVDRWEA